MRSFFSLTLFLPEVTVFFFTPSKKSSSGSLASAGGAAMTTGVSSNSSEPLTRFCTLSFTGDLTSSSVCSFASRTGASMSSSLSTLSDTEPFGTGAMRNG